MTGSGGLRSSISAHDGAVFAVASGRLSDRDVAVSAGRDGNVRLWDMARADCERVVIGAHEGPAIGVAVGRAGNIDIVASAGIDATVRVWDVDGNALHVLTGHAGSVVSVAIASVPDGVVIVSSGDDRTVRVWDAVSGAPLGEPMRGHIGPVAAIAVGRAGPDHVIVSGSADGSLRVWDATTCEAIGEPLTGHVDAVRAVAIGGQRRREVIVSGGTDGTLRLWDAASHEAVGDPLARATSVVAVAVAVLNDRVAVIGADLGGGLQAWDAATHAPYAEPQGGPGASVWAIAVGTDDDVPIVVAGDDEGTLSIWNLCAVRADATSDRVEWVLDAPSTKDELGRAPLVRALAVRLRGLRDGPTATSFLVHIDGRWGSGKSTLLELLSKELERSKEFEPGWLVVRFDAWRQMRIGPPWWALLTSLRRALSEDRRGRFGRVRLRIAEAWRRAPRLHVVASCALLVTVGAGLVGLAPTIDLAGADKVAASLTAAAAAIGVLYGAAAATSRFLLWESAAGAHRFEHAHRNPMDSLAEHFSWLIGRAGRPVVFFIDDLDRCEGHHVVDLLDSIQTLVRVSSSTDQSAPYFVVAADGRWLRESYEQAHTSCGGAVGEPGRPLGYLFLEKIFQVTVDVPSITSYRRDTYLRSLLDQPKATVESDIEKQEKRLEGSTSEAAILRVVAEAPADVRPRLAGLAIERLAEPDLEQSTEHALRRFAPLIEPNPRAMKRFINAYWIARSLQLLDDSYVPLDQLALWTILRARFPALTDCLREQPEAIVALVDGRSAPEGVPQQVAPLFGAPEVMRIVRYTAGVPLDADALYACCGHYSNEARW